ncbi:hypothetical protein MGYG_07065 [Nannizzia gypsea CBS 118893]|uniref:HNH nuclease domain-containing protein n=1 Tax=Arthroderma gypseum (strain ATCC MYA-4604 / CBS 118893) TaxID=535722 RepID=E4V1Z4_ARTGP|nr:hypothetical protein MGYG_07065 [Nannizzia gypsea CBS 118893]EFR04059.1 hypothetical protein MGYG_07065 [Nannizzia gypsea CBS 118893]
MASQQPYDEAVLDLPGRSPVPPQLHDHHQVSFDGIIKYDQPSPLSTAERLRAQDVLSRIAQQVADESGVKGGFHRHLLVRLSYEHSASELSKDTFLRVFFNFMGLELTCDEDIDLNDSGLVQSFIEFADMLLDQFFIPLRASGRKTPQRTPAQISATRSIQSPHEIAGLAERLSYLRSLCLIRDRHRCVISRTFDAQQEFHLLMQHGSNAQDDDGNLLRGGLPGQALEVAHIIPHLLLEMDNNSQLAISAPLTILLPNDGLPVTRKLFFSQGKTIDPPSPRLLALHRAIAHILNLSGAGEYIDKLLRDLEEIGVQADGSTDLGRLITFRLGGQDKFVQAY